MKVVKQIAAVKDGEVVQVVRYDAENELLYHQNRSKDVTLTVDEFLARLGRTIDTGKERGFKVIVSDVGIKESWNVKI